MITKAQATVVATNFQQSLTKRVADWLTSQAQQGIVGGQFVVDAASLSQATQAGTDLTNAGWTVSYNSQTMIATIS